jgi:hypothetical protein
MKTIKETAASVAAGLGCRSQDLEQVWSRMETYSVSLTARSFVMQVAQAMKECGLKPNEANIETLASRL